MRIKSNVYYLWICTIVNTILAGKIPYLYLEKSVLESETPIKYAAINLNV